MEEQRVQVKGKYCVWIKVFQEPASQKMMCLMRLHGNAAFNPGCHFLFSLAEYFEEERKTVLVSKSLNNRVLYRDESKTGLLSTDDSAAAETAL